jgi:hypothetical protein
MYNMNDVLVWHFPYRLENNNVGTEFKGLHAKEVMHVIGHRNV